MWADFAVAELRNGKSVRIQPRGNSMTPIIKSGSTVTLKPAKMEELKKDSIVLVKVKGNVYLHLIKAVQDNRFLIGNNHNRLNGWANFESVYGIVTEID